MAIITSGQMSANGSLADVAIVKEKAARITPSGLSFRPIALLLEGKSGRLSYAE